MSFKVKFWGVRGSIATPSARHIGFGGNTSCVEVKAGSETIIFDAGTGIRNLGHWLLKRGVRSEERRVGKECVSPCRSRLLQYYLNKYTNLIQPSVQYNQYLNIN